MKLDLHVHTCHSFDCSSSLEDVIKSAREAGLEALAITDHDTMSGVNPALDSAGDLVIIPGMEISTWKGTHILGLFLSQEIVSRDIFDIIEEIHSQGGLAVLPHPFRHNSGLMYGHEKYQLYSREDVEKILSLIDLVEAVNMGCREETLLTTHQFLENHSHIIWSAGSDAHTPDRIGSACLMLDVQPICSLDKIKKALLSASRSIRYEAYQSGPSWNKQKPSRSRRLINGLKKPFRRIFGLLPRPEIAEETTY